MMQVGSNPHISIPSKLMIASSYPINILMAFPGDASGRPISCEPERGDLPRADRHKSGQISSRPKTRFLGPQMVVKSQGNSSIFQGKPAVGDIL